MKTNFLSKLMLIAMLLVVACSQKKDDVQEEDFVNHIAGHIIDPPGKKNMHGHQKMALIQIDEVDGTGGPSVGSQIRGINSRHIKLDSGQKVYFLLAFNPDAIDSSAVKYFAYDICTDPGRKCHSED